MIFRNKLQKPDSSCLVAETSFRNQTSLQYRILRNLFGICRTGAPVPVERLLKRTNASQGSIGENWVHFPFFLQVNPNLARSKHFERQDSRIPRHTLGRPKHSPNHSSSYFEPNSSMASPRTHQRGSRTRLTSSMFQRIKKELNQNRRLPWGEAWSDQPLCGSGRSSWRGEEEELRQWLMERIAGNWIIGVGDGRPEMESSLRLIVCNWLLLIILID